MVGAHPGQLSARTGLTLPHSEGCMNTLAAPHSRNYPRQMIRIRGPWRGFLCAAALVIPLVACGGATASPAAVIADFNNDGTIDGQTDLDPAIDVRHSYTDLVAAPALIAVLQPADLGFFLEADQVAVNSVLLGTRAVPANAPTDQPSVTKAEMPTWAIGTVIAASLLALGGIASAFYRRARSRVA